MSVGSVPAQLSQSQKAHRPEGKWTNERNSNEMMQSMGSPIGVGVVGYGQKSPRHLLDDRERSESKLPTKP